MRGEVNAHRLQAAADAVFRGTARTAPGYALCEHQGFPALVGTGVGTVQGELYEVGGETLDALDAFEEHPDLYRRGQVRLADGSTAEAYFLPPGARPGPVIPHGDWRRRERG